MAESTSCAGSTEPEAARFAVWRVLGPLLAVVCVLVGLRSVSAHPAAAAPDAGVWRHDLAQGVELARSEGKPLQLRFSSRAAPLAARMDETVHSLPAEQLSQKHFVNVELDAATSSALFRRWLGGAGALGICILDFAGGAEPDVIAALPGFVEPTRYVEFLDSAAKSLPKLRDLRSRATSSDSARLALGELYAAQGSQPRARVLFTEVPKTSALLARSLEHLARLDAETGRIAGARDELSRAQALGTDNATERFLLTEALVLSAERHVTPAIELLQRELPRFTTPDELARGLLLLGSLEHELGKNADALAHLRRLRDAAPDTAASRSADERIFHIEHPEPGHTH